jgi:hypothetical protein
MRNEVASVRGSLRLLLAPEPEDEQVLVADKSAVVRPFRFFVVDAGVLSDSPHEYDVCDHCKRNPAALLVLGQHSAVWESQENTYQTILQVGQEFIQNVARQGHEHGIVSDHVL